jgi:hypothetical protein
MTGHNFGVRSEFSGPFGYGKITDLVERCQELDQNNIPLADIGTTAGIYAFSEACLAAGAKAVFGATLPVDCNVANDRSRKPDLFAFLANDRLRPLFETVALATSQAHGRDFSLTAAQAASAAASGLTVIVGPRTADGDKLCEAGAYVGLTPQVPFAVRDAWFKRGYPLAAGGCNRFIRQKDAGLYEVAAGRSAETTMYPGWIMSRDELRIEFDRMEISRAIQRKAFANTEAILDKPTAKLETASLPELPGAIPVEIICRNRLK